MAIVQQKKPGIEDALAQRQRAKPIAALNNSMQTRQANPLGTIATATTTQVNDPYAYRNKPWQEQLGMFQNDSALAKTELERATKQAALYKALGQTDKYNTANKWIGQLHAVTNNSLLNTPNKVADNRMEGLYNQLAELKTQATAKPDPFSYDPNNDPQYQVALRLAQQNAQTAAGDIAADMNKRGLLNSTITADRGNQAAQREYSRVSNEVLPALMQQAYNRYQDEQTRQRNAILDQLGILEREGTLINQQRDDAQYLREYQDTRLDAENKAKAEAEAAKAKAESDAEQQQYDRAWDIAEGVGILPKYLTDMFGLPPNTSTLDAAEMGIKRMDAETRRKNAETSARNAQTSAGQLELSRQRENRIASNQSSGGQSKPDDYDYEADTDFQDDLAYVIMNPADARSALKAQANEFIRKYGPDGYNALVRALPRIEE